MLTSKVIYNASLGEIKGFLDTMRQGYENNQETYKRRVHHYCKSVRHWNLGHRADRIYPSPDKVLHYRRIRHEVHRKNQVRIIC